MIPKMMCLRTRRMTKRLAISIFRTKKCHIALSLLPLFLPLIYHSLKSGAVVSMNRKLLPFLIVLALIIILPPLLSKSGKTKISAVQESHHSITKEDIFMSEMTNQTIKQQLGQASWRLLHTIAAKFPVEPTHQQKATLLNFLYTFAKVYPCGDCAKHFTQVLADHPPENEVESRGAVTQWMCKVHNVVNKRLKKPEFDCSLVKGLIKSR